jgi:hypothetical protein
MLDSGQLQIRKAGCHIGRCDFHFTCGEPGWEAVADFGLDWALDPQPGVLDAPSQHA